MRAVRQRMPRSFESKEYAMKIPRQRLIPIFALSLICSAVMPASFAIAKDSQMASSKPKAAKEEAAARKTSVQAVLAPAPAADDVEEA